MRIAGLNCEEWLGLWNWCHTAGFSGPMRLCWPDGKGVLDQPAITTEVFDMISDQVSKAAKSGGTS